MVDEVVELLVTVDAYAFEGKTVGKVHLRMINNQLGVLVAFDFTDGTREILLASAGRARGRQGIQLGKPDLSGVNIDIALPEVGAAEGEAGGS